MKATLEPIENVLDWLRTAMQREFGGPSLCAKALGISSGNMSEAMNGHGNRRPPRKLLAYYNIVWWNGAWHRVEACDE